MKTSATQFKLMVSFMEQHGDLNKPSSHARGKIFNLQKWEELTVLLNSDGSGDTKTCEKWRKVWSDYKNNIKKKAARLHRAARGTSGGPAILSRLSDLERRGLNLIGMHVATGLAIDEAGLSQEVNCEANPTLNMASSVTITQERSTSSPPLAFADKGVLSSELRNKAGPSRHPHMAISPISPSILRPVVSHLIFASPQVENLEIPTQVHVSPVAPALAGQTTFRRVRPARMRKFPRRPIRPAHSDQVSQLFLQAENHWREFKEQQHKDYMDMRREHNRILEMKVHMQREWLEVAARGLDILEKLVNK